MRPQVLKWLRPHSKVLILTTLAHMFNFTLMGSSIQLDGTSQMCMVKQMSKFCRSHVDEPHDHRIQWSSTWKIQRSALTDPIAGMGPKSVAMLGKLPRAPESQSCGFTNAPLVEPNKCYFKQGWLNNYFSLELVHQLHQCRTALFLWSFVLFLDLHSFSLYSVSWK